MKLNNTFSPMGSLANNKAPQAKPNLNTQRDGSVELVITTGENTLNFSGFLNGVTSDLIKHLSARILETPHGIQNRLLADTYIPSIPSSPSFRENTKQELAQISRYLGLYLEGDPLHGKAKPIIFLAHMEIQHPYKQIKHSGIREDFQRLDLPKNKPLNADLTGSLFIPAAADGEQLFEVRFLPAGSASNLHGNKGLESNLNTIREIKEIIGQIGGQIFDKKA